MSKYRGSPWIVLIVMSLGFFMTLLDLTIVNIAIPDMITRLHATLDGVLWVINAYALVLAVLLITAGRLGDLFGQRRMFIVGVILFTLASAACGFSPSVGWLVAFRAIQGVGAAMLLPQTLAILTTVFPPERRGAAFGIWGAVAGVATIAGPTLGGLLVSAFDWRYIFFINVPIGALVIVMSFFLIPDVRVGARHRLDIPGVLLATVALLAICYGLVEGQKYNWGHITSFISIPMVIAAGVVLLGAFLLVQARSQDREPLVPFALFRDRNFSLMNWVSGVLSVGMMGIFLPFTIYLQSALGFSALTVLRPDAVRNRLRPDRCHRDDAVDLAGLHRDPGHCRGGNGLYVRADDYDRDAEHRAEGGRRRIGHDQHSPAGRSGDRHGGRRRPAPEPPRGLAAGRRGGTSGIAAAAGEGPLHRRVRQVRSARSCRESKPGKCQAAEWNARLAGRRDPQASR